MNKKQIENHTLEMIAEMICGDRISFPYRSSSFLTSFFSDDLELPYSHDGSTRKWWVLSVIKELNQNDFNFNDILSDEVLRVLENLFNIKYFLSEQSDLISLLDKTPDGPGPIVNYENAIKAANILLKHVKVEVVKDRVGLGVQIRSLNGILISTDSNVMDISKRFEFVPTVFNVTDISINPKLVSVMMPFGREFDGVYKVIRDACDQCCLDCKRADDIWEKSVIVEDVFNLICSSQIVLVDFSGKNPNVMYETGIAHTLGKHVIPISQSMVDVPFDLQHHRCLAYLLNSEGLRKLRDDLIKKLSSA
ncbi:MAG: hypothetical protein KAS93_00375 [Gammaproteobacteria bacterium]|nr:hypothetical protein [Gammaproteobacteria bacterium]